MMEFEFIERVVKLVETSDIGELEVESQEGLRIVVKKTPALPPSIPAAFPSVNTGAITMAAGQVPVSPEPQEDDSIEVIKSPMVGTFYRAPAPDAPTFVQIGDVVQASTVVCILEAMKVMNEIKSGLSGTVQDVLVENGQSVEFGQALFKIKKH